MSDQQEQEQVHTEEFTVSGEAVVSTVKRLIREGNVRRIVIKNEEGRTFIEIPLTVGVVGAVLLPVWAAIGAIAALVANLTIVVERPLEPEAAESESGDVPPGIQRLGNDSSSSETSSDV